MPCYQRPAWSCFKWQLRARLLVCRFWLKTCSFFVVSFPADVGQKFKFWSGGLKSEVNSFGCCLQILFQTEKKKQFKHKKCRFYITCGHLLERSNFCLTGSTIQGGGCSGLCAPFIYLSSLLIKNTHKHIHTKIFWNRKEENKEFFSQLESIFWKFDQLKGLFSRKKSQKNCFKTPKTMDMEVTSIPLWIQSTHF